MLRRRRGGVLLATAAAAGLAGLALGGGATAAVLPVATPGDVTTNEDATVQVTLAGTDADGDPLTFAIGAEPASGGLGPIGGSTCDPGPPSSCTATVDYTPGADANGSDSFTFTVNDGADGTSSPATVAITIDPVNDPPVADDDADSTDEDAPLVIALADLLANDHDVDLDTLAVDVFDAVSDEGGSIVDNLDGTLTYTPPDDFNGSDAFGYTAIDGNGGSDDATVSVSVIAVNDAPVASDDTTTGLEDQPRSISVLAGDTDVDDDPLTVIDTTDGDHGAVSITNQGAQVRYAPDADYNGPDSFSYTVADGNGGEAAGTVTITITAVNDIPTLEVPPGPTVAEDSGHESVGGYLDGEAGPANERLVQSVDFVIDDVTATTLFSEQPHVNPNGTLTFTPAPNAHGQSIVTVHVHDSGGTANGGVNVSPPQTFSITVTPVNDPPSPGSDGTPTPIAVAQNVGPTPLHVLANDTVLPDSGETLDIVTVTQGAHGAVAITGGGSDLTYDPTGSFTGPDTFTYTVSDGVLEATATVHVNVAPDITPPVTSIRVVGAASRSSSSVRVVVTWSAAELQSGISLYQLQQRIDTGAWTTIPLSSATATSAERILAGGHDYAFRVRAKDGIGNQGAFTTSRPLRL